MKFTEDFIELPVAIYRSQDFKDFYETTVKVLPRDICGWMIVKAPDGGEMLVIRVSSFGEFYVRLTIDELEALINKFVGEPVTYTEKHIALMAKMLEKLNEP